MTRRSAPRRRQCRDSSTVSRWSDASSSRRRPRHRARRPAGLERRCLRRRQPRDNPQDPGLTSGALQSRTGRNRRFHLGVVGHCVRWRWLRTREQESKAQDGAPLFRVQQPIGPDTVKALGRDVLEEATQEFLSAEGHRLSLADFAVTIGEGDLALVGSDEALVGHGGAVHVAPEVVEEHFGFGMKGAFGIDDPWLVPGGHRKFGGSELL